MIKIDQSNQSLLVRVSQFPNPLFILIFHFKFTILFYILLFVGGLVIFVSTDGKAMLD